MHTKKKKVCNLMSGRRIVRFSLDLEEQQRNYVRLFALKNGINASVVMRAMLFKLETDPEFANEIIDLIFYVPEEEVSEDEYEAPEEAATPVNNEAAPVEEVTVLKIGDLKPGDFIYDAEGKKVVIE
jgi:hypothetical protein